MCVEERVVTSRLLATDLHPNKDQRINFNVDRCLVLIGLSCQEIPVSGLDNSSACCLPCTWWWFLRFSIRGRARSLSHLSLLQE